MEPSEIWGGVFDEVRQSLAVPMVWLAMQAAKPLTIDGNFFVAGLPRQDEYLASHLQDNQAATAIEDALRHTTGRVLAFRLIKGETLADWDAEKTRTEKARTVSETPSSVTASAEPPPAFFRSAATPPPADVPEYPTEEDASPPMSLIPIAELPREVSATWDNLSERLSRGYKSAPFIKYPHGQAQYVLTAVKMISDTMDVLMPPVDAPRDDTQERLLAKAIERLSGVINLDPLFLSLELLRYRERQGKNRDILIP